MDAIDEVLKRRLANPDAYRWDAKALRLPCPGDAHLGLDLTDEGWALRELQAVPDWRRLMTTDYDALIDATRVHWAAEWAREDAEAAAKKAEQEKWRAEAAERQRVEKLKREAAARRDAWVACGVPEALRYDVATHEDRAMFATSKARADTLAQVHSHPMASEDDLRRRYLNLALLGPTGTGKSLLSAIWLHGHMMCGEPGRFVDARTLARTLGRARDRDKEIAALAELEYLVVDDFLADPEDCEPERVGAIVEVLSARSMRGTFTCYSSNRSAEELATVLGPRGYSRAMHNALVLVIDGPDWRLPTAWQPETASKAGRRQ